LLNRRLGSRFAESRKDEPERTVNGFCSIFTPPFRPFADLSQFDYLALNVQTCGRPYMFGVRVNFMIDNCIYQAGIKPDVVPRPMHELYIPMDAMIKTRNGRRMKVQTPLPRNEVESFGFVVTGPSGPFRLELECIEARSHLYDWHAPLDDAEYDEVAIADLEIPRGFHGDDLTQMIEMRFGSLDAWQEFNKAQRARYLGRLHC